MPTLGKMPSARCIRQSFLSSALRRHVQLIRRSTLQRCVFAWVARSLMCSATGVCWLSVRMLDLLKMSTMPCPSGDWCAAFKCIRSGETRRANEPFATSTDTESMISRLNLEAARANILPRSLSADCLAGYKATVMATAMAN
ncbi:MAG: hypothetical protein LQ345_003770 [Seirophora villosa]|nr:MAG: hypothetical protein LQ345_003770 [Seirophora villosa]